MSRADPLRTIAVDPSREESRTYALITINGSQYQVPLYNGGISPNGEMTEVEMGGMRFLVTRQQAADLFRMAQRTAPTWKDV